MVQKTIPHTLSHFKIDLNLMMYNAGRPKGARLGTSQYGHVEKICRLYVSQLNKLIRTQQLNPEDLPGFRTYIGSLGKIMQCTRKTVQNRIRHYVKCDVITKMEYLGSKGIMLWFHPDIVFKNQKGYEDFMDRTSEDNL